MCVCVCACFALSSKWSIGMDISAHAASLQQKLRHVVPTNQRSKCLCLRLVCVACKYCGCAADMC